LKPFSSYTAHVFKPLLLLLLFPEPEPELEPEPEPEPEDTAYAAAALSASSFACFSLVSLVTSSAILLSNVVISPSLLNAFHYSASNST